jgi:hypothetical protein
MTICLLLVRATSRQQGCVFTRGIRIRRCNARLDRLLARQVKEPLGRRNHIVKDKCAVNKNHKANHLQVLECLPL